VEGELQRRQAEMISATLRRIMRGLFPLGPDDPGQVLSLAQWRVCVLLSEGPLPMSGVSRELGISLSATTQLADRLERDGLVQRLTDPDDRRVRILSNTPHAQELVQIRTQQRVDGALTVIQRLSTEERRDVIHALEILERASGQKTAEEMAKTAGAADE